MVMKAVMKASWQYSISLSSIKHWREHLVNSMDPTVPLKLPNQVLS